MRWLDFSNEDRLDALAGIGALASRTHNMAQDPAATAAQRMRRLRAAAAMRAGYALLSQDTGDRESIVVFLGEIAQARQMMHGARPCREAQLLVRLAEDIARGIDRMKVVDPG